MSKLGKHSNDPRMAAEEDAAERRAGVHEIGDYVLIKHDKWQLYEVSRKDGKPVPQGLAGRWTDLNDFREALSAFKYARAT